MWVFIIYQFNIILKSKIEHPNFATGNLVNVGVMRAILLGRLVDVVVNLHLFARRFKWRRIELLGHCHRMRIIIRIVNADASIISALLFRQLDANQGAILIKFDFSSSS